jgi:hypothetical protein
VEIWLLYPIKKWRILCSIWLLLLALNAEILSKKGTKGYFEVLKKKVGCEKPS